jgi:uncharacterized protein YgbK (DUF1537 family)
MELLVAADDRTGAIETAAALADRGAGPVPVIVWPYRLPEHGSAAVEVVDLETRHASPEEAAERAVAVERPGPAAHKIDSTLRGNWSVELPARHRASGRPVLLVPALPELARTCVNGIVLDHGRPVHEGPTDPRSRVHTSRPADLLTDADDVVELTDRGAVASWLAAPHGIGIADAASDDDIAAIVAAWREAPDVLLAGTSSVIGAVAGEPVSGVDPPVIDGPVLVVCGSVHPMARAQIGALEQRGVVATSIVDELAVGTLRRDGRLVLATEIPFGDVDTPLAIAAATTLARGVRDILDTAEVGALVLLGGDTTAAVLGDADVAVHGTIAPGTAWSTVEGVPMPVITRAGGFGSDHALVDLLWRVLA